jgi:D-inositol-3-phosphate glycosyltransferase
MTKTKGRLVPVKPKLLWVGDAVATTGFGTVTHGVLDRLHKTWDVSVLGVNYLGDPHTYPYPIYPAQLGGDIWGLGRLEQLVAGIDPDVVVILNDPWVVKDYLPMLSKYRAKVAAYIPIDAKNVRKDFVAPLNQLDLAIPYTQFGLDELTKSGLTIPTTIIPHGFDSSVYKPMPSAEARKPLGLAPSWFVVGCVARNQPRKRLDLLVQYFAEWVHTTNKPNSVRLYPHCAMQDIGWDIVQMAQYRGIEDRLIVTDPKQMSASRGVPREALANIYNSFDVHAMTTAGEG